MDKNKKGFTMIELMIVIVIIAILAAVLFPNFMRTREASKLTACKSNLKNMSTAIEIYANDFNGLYPGFSNQGGATTIENLGDPTSPNAHPLISKYINKIMVCPKARSTDYRYIITNPSKYWIYCPAVSINYGANVNSKHKKGNTEGGLVLDSIKGILERLY